MSRILYTDPKGKDVTEFSHSAANDYRQSPAAFYWKRVRGYRERIQGAALSFGIDLQEAVRKFYIEGRDPVQTFEDLWTVHQDKELDYGKKGSWSDLCLAGRDLMRSLAANKNHLHNPLFPGWKERFKYHDQKLDVDYVSIPDIVDRDENGPFCVDIKAFARPVKASELSVIMHSQLRTQAACTGIYRVVLWVFSKSDGTIQWLEGSMTKEHADSALRADLSLTAPIMRGEFGCRCGISYPNDTLKDCPFRGMCLEQGACNASEDLRKQWRQVTAEELKPWDELGDLE